MSWALKGRWTSLADSSGGQGTRAQGTRDTTPLSNILAESISLVPEFRKQGVHSSESQESSFQDCEGGGVVKGLIDSKYQVTAVFICPTEEFF